MGKGLLVSLFAFSFVCAEAFAGNVLPEYDGNLVLLQDKGVKEMKELPAAVRTFLQSKEGRGFKEADFVSAIENMNREVSYIAQSGYAAPVEEPAFSEDFSLWAAGSDTAPDSKDICDELDSYMALPGWTGLSVYQAGGSAFLGMYEDPEEGASPGYLLTPAINLGMNDGAYRIKIRAKSQLESQSLQFFCLNLGSSGITGAKAISITDEWGDYEIDFNGGKEQLGIMFYGSLSGNILVDNIEVFSLNYGILRPEITSVNMVSCSSIDVEWTKVDEATSYIIDVYSRDGDTFEDSILLEGYDTGSAETSCRVEGLELNPANDYYVTVRSCDGVHASLPTGWELIVPGEVQAPVAMDATDISYKGFTANWSEVGMAWTYYLDVTAERVAKDGEEFVFIDEDFGKFTAGSLYDDTGAASLAIYYDPLDGYMSQSGWTACFGLSAGVEAFITTNMGEEDGIPGMLVSPAYDFSIGGGVVNVSFDAQSIMGNDIVLLVGFVGEDNQVNVDASELVEVGAETTAVDVQITGGANNNKLIIYFWDGEMDFVMIDNLKVTMTLNEGDKYKATVACTTLDRGTTSYRVDAPWTDGGKYSYSVKASYPYYSEPMTSDFSNVMIVDVPAAGVDGVTAVNAVTVHDGVVNIVNEDGYAVSICSVNGSLLYSDSSGNREQTFKLLQSGVYVVRIGDKAYKLVE